MNVIILIARCIHTFNGGCKQIGFISNRIKGHFCGVFVNLYIAQ